MLPSTSTSDLSIARLSQLACLLQESRETTRDLHTILQHAALAPVQAAAATSPATPDPSQPVASTYAIRTSSSDTTNGVGAVPMRVRSLIGEPLAGAAIAAAAVMQPPPGPTRHDRFTSMPASTVPYSISSVAPMIAGGPSVFAPGGLPVGQQPFASFWLHRIQNAMLPPAPQMTLPMPLPPSHCACSMPSFWTSGLPPASSLRSPFAQPSAPMLPLEAVQPMTLDETQHLCALFNHHLALDKRIDGFLREVHTFQEQRLDAQVLAHQTEQYNELRTAATSNYPSKKKRPKRNHIATTNSAAGSAAAPAQASNHHGPASEAPKKQKVAHFTDSNSPHILRPSPSSEVADSDSLSLLSQIPQLPDMLPTKASNESHSVANKSKRSSASSCQSIDPSVAVFGEPPKSNGVPLPHQPPKEFISWVDCCYTGSPRASD